MSSYLKQKAFCYMESCIITVTLGSINLAPPKFPLPLLPPFCTALASINISVHSRSTKIFQILLPIVAAYINILGLIWSYIVNINIM